MAMSQAPDAMSGQAMEVPYCPICIEPYKKPKVLPCGHTFCHACIKRVGQHKRPGDTLACPQCRAVFTVPWRGFRDLPNNYIILQSTPITFTSAEVKCCIQHPLKEIEFYCCDCKTTSCVICYKEKHMKHKCVDVKEALTDERVNNEMEQVESCIRDCQQALKQNQENQKMLTDKVGPSREEISNKYDELLSLLQSQRNQLMHKLDSLQDKAVKELQTKNDGLKVQLLSLACLKTFWDKRGRKGSSCETSDESKDLLARIDELVKKRVELMNMMSSQLPLVDVKFIPSSTANANDWIGNLIITEDDGQGVIADQEIVGPDFSSTLFLQSIPVVHQILDQDNGHSIHGIASVNKRVFVMRNETEHIQLYDANDFTKTPTQKKLGRNQLRFPRIVACPNYYCVFVSTVIDTQSNLRGAINTPSSVIYRTAISLGGAVVEWTVKGHCSGLSMTNNDDLLVTLSSEGLIEECTRDGKLIRQINLDRSLPPPLHCVQLSNGKFAVSHSGPMAQKQISIVNARGTVLHQILQPFLGSEGSTVIEFEDPGQLTIDKHNRLFVVDCSSNRILVLDPTLTPLGNFHISGCEMQQAFALHLDNRRLYVGELNGRLLVFGAPFIPTNSTNNRH